MFTGYYEFCRTHSRSEKDCPNQKLAAWRRAFSRSTVVCVVDFVYARKGFRDHPRQNKQNPSCVRYPVEKAGILVLVFRLQTYDAVPGGDN